MALVGDGGYCISSALPIGYRTCSPSWGVALPSTARSVLYKFGRDVEGAETEKETRVSFSMCFRRQTPDESETNVDGGIVGVNEYVPYKNRKKFCVRKDGTSRRRPLQDRRGIRGNPVGRCR